MDRELSPRLRVGPWQGSACEAQPAMTLYTFCSGWEPAPKALADAMLLAIGDVHGHLEHLDALLEQLRPEISGPNRSASHATWSCWATMSTAARTAWAPCGA